MHRRDHDRRAGKVLDYAVEDVHVLRPLYELGRAYHYARSQVIDAVDAASRAVDRIVRSTPGGAMWRHAAAELLAAADGLVGAAETVSHSIGESSLARAIAAAPPEVALVLQDSNAERWNAARFAIELAGHRLEWDLAVASQPWGHFAFCGWRYAEQRVSWREVWFARAPLLGFDVYPDRTMAEAASEPDLMLTSSAARKARTRAAWWTPRENGRDPAVIGQFGVRPVSDFK